MLHVDAILHAITFAEIHQRFFLNMYVKIGMKDSSAKYSLIHAGYTEYLHSFFAANFV